MLCLFLHYFLSQHIQYHLIYLLFPLDHSATLPRKYIVTYLRHLLSKVWNRNCYTLH